MVEPEVPTLRTVLGPHPLTAALTGGEVHGEGVRLAFEPIEPVHRAFAPMVRRESFDLCELAVVTALQAVAHGCPVVVLPAVVAARFQRGCLIAHRSRPVSADELAGRRVGVRSWTQTTGMWVRAHLREDVGLEADQVCWATREDAHVEQYRDPGFVRRDPASPGLVEALRAGTLDAVVLGNDLPAGDEFVPVTAHAPERDLAWSQRHGFVPINHMVVAAASTCQERPAAVRAGYELLRRADARTTSTDGPGPTMFGLERLRDPLALVIEHCLAQGLLPRRLDPDEVLAPAAALLGGAA